MSMRTSRSSGAVAVAVAFFTACAAPTGKPTGLGRRLAAGQARNLLPSPDGTQLAYLDHCVRPRQAGLPEDATSCDLEVVPAAAGGAPRRLATQVSSLGLGFAWSPGPGASTLAMLADYDYGRGTGTLMRARITDGVAAKAEKLADDVGFYGFAPSGALGFIAQGQLSVLWPDGAQPEAMAALSPASTFDFNPAWRPGQAGGPAVRLLARKPLASGGDLLGLLDPSGVVHFGTQVGDYRFSPAGKDVAFTARREGKFELFTAPADRRGGTPRALGRDVQTFAYSSDGSGLAFLSGAAPGTPGDLLLVGKGEPERLAGRVGELRWASRASRLAWLQDYDPRIRSGTLAVGAAGEKPVVLGKRVTQFDLAPDGRSVAFVEHVTAGGYSVDLKLARIGPELAIVGVARGVFGFAFSPDGRTLYYRTNCVGQADACDLQSLSVEDAGAKSIVLAEGVKSFEFAAGRSDLLLITWVRRDMSALDLAVLRGTQLVAVDKAALAGSAQFLGPGAQQVAFVVADPKRAGVYLAELPK
jgi:hypothetical protein